eukprot:TRINITY_DN4913_c0_g1_i1.p1 TRINITY_DN4913_c0_g1~~TRINITY_DN4913_c0_g1_i1.p1  ORF type:complete len:722 (+),score=230.78 TRINITY_DN4913_c0_g1_i1:128-2293(+)
METTRATLKNSKRIVIKIGSAIIAREDQNGISLSRIGSIVEQIFEIKQRGMQVIIVSSGAVAIGRHKLTEFKKMNGVSKQVDIDKRSCAAAGQSGLMSLYETMFGYFGIGTSQVLVTGPDFKDNERVSQLRNTLDVLLECGAIPIVNENDVVSVKQDMIDTASGIRSFNDNDGLAALISSVAAADLMILLSDVDGVCTSPPGTQGSQLIQTFHPVTDMKRVNFEGRSKVGTGGMGSKILAAIQALDHGSKVVIANGLRGHTIVNVIDGKRIGTLFSYKKDDAQVRDMAIEIRSSSRILSTFNGDRRNKILHRIAEGLDANREKILEENSKDVQRERQLQKLSSSSLARLILTSEKLDSLIVGVRSVADFQEDPMGKILKNTELAPNLNLKHVTVPLGVLLIIFESRPDAIVQIASLAIKSGNGVLLKGGSEAANSNRILHKVISDAISVADEGMKDRTIIGLVESRDDISELLAMDDLIDLVIPRGSGNFVRYVQQNTKIPVMGHSEGICHVFVDVNADMSKACQVVVDSKVEYPAACNAMETLLVHKDLQVEKIRELLKFLQNSGVTIFCGPKIFQDENRRNFPELSESKLAPTLKMEYGDLRCTIEMVDSIDDAIAHVHAHGSGHTDAIVTEDLKNANRWMTEVDSACVFHNASTRFADGFRFGLGAEVGISTGRIHARGPVGVEGLMTSKWILNSELGIHTVAPYSKGEKEFTHVHHI